MRIFVLTMGFIIAVFVAFGRVIVDALGANTVWYTCFLAVPYLLLSLLLSHRLGVTARNERPTTRAVWVLAVLSWVSGIAFALTVPDVLPDGSLAAITAPPGADPVTVEIVVALCNPFAIGMFVFLLLACIVSWFNSRPAYVDPED
ncbi:hypothetical protein EII31_07195 [Leucobacter sp. OH2974_COT-288]|nr:hypothetical protein EII31_07195 [Leucobacter sp. OH2974_COT-288]